ncbi:MAG: hypothetical protein P1P64_01740 [Treponemataceae bacterium]
MNNEIKLNEDENLDEWQTRKYTEFFSEECDFLKRRLERGKTDLADLEGILESLYIFDDNNQDGRSLIMQLSLSASIAAYESIISKLKNEAKKTQ